MERLSNLSFCSAVCAAGMCTDLWNPILTKPKLWRNAESPYYNTGCVLAAWISCLENKRYAMQLLETQQSKNIPLRETESVHG
jgi:hypothetical protein